MSTIRAATVADLAGTGPTTLMGQTAAKAWVNWNGVGTLAIRGSANISSVTDNSVGNFTPNFTSAFADANYGTVGMSCADAGNNGFVQKTRTDTEPQLTTSCRVSCVNPTTPAAYDPPQVSLAFLR